VWPEDGMRYGILAFSESLIGLFCMRKLLTPGRERKKQLVIFARFAIVCQEIGRLPLICRADNLSVLGKAKKKETSPGNCLLYLLRKFQ
jgi:hypothetical protein